MKQEARNPFDTASELKRIGVRAGLLLFLMMGGASCSDLAPRDAGADSTDVASRQQGVSVNTTWDKNDAGMSAVDDGTAYTFTASPTGALKVYSGGNIPVTAGQTNTITLTTKLVAATVGAGTMAFNAFDSAGTYLGSVSIPGQALNAPGPAGGTQTFSVSVPSGSTASLQLVADWGGSTSTGKVQVWKAVTSEVPSTGTAYTTYWAPNSANMTQVDNGASVTLTAGTGGLSAYSGHDMRVTAGQTNTLTLSLRVAGGTARSGTMAFNAFDSAGNYLGGVSIPSQPMAAPTSAFGSRTFDVPVPSGSTARLQLVPTWDNAVSGDAVELKEDVTVGGGGGGGGGGTPGWSHVQVHGGGWMTGMVTGPGGKVYGRADVGGAYRWNGLTSKWEQLVTGTGVPNPRTSDYDVESLAVAPGDGNVLYMAVGADIVNATGRILKSTNAGSTWSDPSTRRFKISGNEDWRWGGERLSVDPANTNIVMFGTRREGLWRSTDGGVSWAQQTGVPLGASPRGVSFTVFKPGTAVGGVSQQAYVGVAGDANAGVYRTTNAGATWTKVSGTLIASGATPRHAQMVSVGGVWKLYVAVNGSPSKVLEFTDATVRDITPAFSGQFSTVAVNPSNTNQIFVGDEGVRSQKMWRSTNGGLTYQALDVSIWGDTARDPWINASDIAGWMSTGAFAFDTHGTLWFAEGMGMWRAHHLTVAAPGPFQWNFTSDGIEELVANFAVKPAGRPLVTTSWDRGLWRHPSPSTGGAAQLLPVDPANGKKGFGSGWDVTASPTDPNFLVAILDDHQDRYDLDPRRASGYSSDGGATWTRFPALVGKGCNTGCTAYSYLPNMRFGNIAVSANNNNNIVWVPSNLFTAEIYYSTDKGATWQAATLNGRATNDFLHPNHYLKRKILVADPSAAGVFYALGGNNDTGNAILWKSTNAGATWNKVAATGLRAGYWDFRYNSNLVAASGRLYALPGRTDDASRPYFSSADGGVTWTMHEQLLDAHGLAVSAPTTGGGNRTFYTYGKTSTSAHGLYRSTDLGASWTRLAGYPNNWHQAVTSVAGDPDDSRKVYLGLVGGGWVTYTAQ
jgi:hypothetical protein